MKNLIFLLVILGYTLFCFSLYAVQDTNVVWSISTYRVQDIFNHPDSNYIFANQSDIKRFAKIDSRTGVIVDSIYFKGSIIGISSDNKFIYTGGNTIQSIKKLDINSYKTIDSVDNIEDVTGEISDLKLSHDSRIFLTFANSKYLFVILNANNLELIYKKAIKEVSDSLYDANQIAVSPQNNFFVLHQLYQYLDTAKNTWHYWDEAVVWDMKTLLSTYTIQYNSSISQFYIFNFSPDGKYFFMRDTKLRIFDTKDFTMIKQMYATRCIDFSLNKNFFAINLDPIMQFYSYPELI